MYCIKIIISTLSPITQIQYNSHNLGIYSSPQRKIEDGLDNLILSRKKCKQY